MLLGLRVEALHGGVREVNPRFYVSKLLPAARSEARKNFSDQRLACLASLAAQPRASRGGASGARACGGHYSCATPRMTIIWTLCVLVDWAGGAHPDCGRGSQPCRSVQPPPPRVAPSHAGDPVPDGATGS